MSRRIQAKNVSDSDRALATIQMEGWALAKLGVIKELDAFMNSSPPSLLLSTLVCHVHAYHNISFQLSSISLLILLMVNSKMQLTC
jgi:hypothetical protein